MVRRDLHVADGIDGGDFIGPGVPFRDHVDRRVGTVVFGAAVIVTAVQVIFRVSQIVFLRLFAERGGFHVVRNVQMLEMLDFTFWRHHSIAAILSVGIGGRECLLAGCGRVCGCIHPGGLFVRWICFVIVVEVSVFITGIIA